MRSMSARVKGRNYDNSERLAQAAANRQRVLDAARDSLVERGYRATTIARIAAAAGVHVATVYELVGRKPVILRELIEQALSGTDQPVEAEQREYVVAIRREPDPRRKLALYAEAITDIHRRLAPLMLALRDASSTESEAYDVWRAVGDRRARNMVLFAQDLEQAGGLRADLSVSEAADTIWATNSAELYVLLTTDRGWSPRRYRRWLTDTWSRLLLPDT